MCRAKTFAQEASDCNAYNTKNCMGVANRQKILFCYPFCMTEGFLGIKTIIIEPFLKTEHLYGACIKGSCMWQPNKIKLTNHFFIIYYHSFFITGDLQEDRRVSSDRNVKCFILVVSCGWRLHSYGHHKNNGFEKNTRSCSYYQKFCLILTWTWRWG